jgi:hypothetical protein
VQAPGGTLVRDAATLQPGMPVHLRFARGSADAEIVSVQSGGASAPPDTPGPGAP